MKKTKITITPEILANTMIDSGFQFRMSDINHKKEIMFTKKFESYMINKWYNIDDYVIVKLYNMFKKNENFSHVTKNDVYDAVSYVCQDNLYNPIEQHIINTVADSIEYSEREDLDVFHKGPAQMKARNIEKLSHTLSELKLLREILTFEEPWQHDVLECWLYGCVRKLVERSYQNFVVILNGKQGVGKSSFFNVIADGAGLKEYLVSMRIETRSKDHLGMLADKWIWLIDEIGVLFKTRERDEVKEFFTKTVVTVRPPYGREAVNFVPISNFCGTTNDDHILTDATGERRYAVLKLRDADLFMMRNVFDPRLMWLQIYNDIMYRGMSIKAELTNELKEKIEEYSKDARVKTDAEFYLDEFVINTGNKNHYIQTAHLAAILQRKSNNKTKKLEHFYLDVADYLKLKGIEKFKKRIGERTPVCIQGYTLDLRNYDYTWTLERFYDEIRGLN